jgi:hypothetical protein
MFSNRDGPVPSRIPVRPMITVRNFSPDLDVDQPYTLNCDEPLYNAASTELNQICPRAARPVRPFGQAVLPRSRRLRSRHAGARGTTMEAAGLQVLAGGAVWRSNPRLASRSRLHHAAQ